jgi:sporulation protein YhbH
MATPPDSIFRPFRSSDAERSDRSAGDRARHRHKVRESIRSNIADIIAEESIIGQDRDRVIKIPLRGIREYRFVFGENAPGVAQGEGDTEAGTVIGQADATGRTGEGPAGDRPGIDYYETEVTLDELVEIMFEDLELPDLERRALRRMDAIRMTKRKGYRPVGIRTRLDRHRTVRARHKRRLAARGHGERVRPHPRFPYHDSDLVYRHVTTETHPESNAVVFCLMDTSGSMDTMKKYLARSFFFLLYQFICTKYQNVDLVFVAHHTQAREVTEEEFFHKGESGGTFISSAYAKTLEIIQDRFHPSLWNVYVFHCSDGDNFESDNAAAVRLLTELTEICNLVGYGEIKPEGSRHYESSMLNVFRRVEAENFHTGLIEQKSDVWPAFKAFLQKDASAREA